MYMSHRQAVALMAAAAANLPGGEAGGVCFKNNRPLNDANKRVHALQQENTDLLAVLSKETCQPGNHYTTTKHGCVECPENQFRTDSMGDCAKCSNGMVSDAGASMCRYDLHGQSEFMCEPNTIVANDPTGMLGNCRVRDPKKGEFSLGYTTNLEFSKCGQAGDGYDFAKMNSKESPCTPCTPGTYSKDGFCAPCDKNQYQDRSGQASCKPCNMPGSLASMTEGAQTCGVSQRVQNAATYGEGSWAATLANLAIQDESRSYMHPDVQNAIYDNAKIKELVKTTQHNQAYKASAQYRSDHMRDVADKFEASRRPRY